MNAKHTPGPWNVGKRKNIAAACNVMSGSIQIARVTFSRTERSANARLISAAPELLEVAESILVDDVLQYLPAEYVAKVRAAIAKARGEE